MSNTGYTGQHPELRGTRTMKLELRRPRTAVLAALSLLAAPVVAIAGAPAVATAAVPASFTCNTGSNSAAFETSYSPNATFTLTPASAAPGDEVTATFDADSGLTNASPVELGAGTAQPLVFVELAWTGAPASFLVLKTPVGSYPATPIAIEENVGPWTATATATAAGAGTATATIWQIVVNGGLPTYCGVTADNYPNTSVSNPPAIGGPVDPAVPGFPVDYNGPYPAAAGTWQDNNGYQAFKNNSGTGVTINVGSAPVKFGSATMNVLEPQPAISLQKSAVTTSFSQVGDEIDYEFDVTNSGSTSLTDIAIDDPLIASVDCSSITEPFASGATGTCTGTYTVDAGDITAGQVDNTATATATSGQSEIQSDPSSATVEIATAELELTKSVDPTIYSFVGDELTYSFDVENTGDFDVTNVTIDDDLIDTVTCPAGAANLAVGATVTCTATYAATADDITATSIVNTATASATYAGDATVTSAESTATATYAAPIPDLDLTKSADVTTFSGADQTITYSFDVDNTGAVPLADVAIVDPLIPDVDCSSVDNPLAPGDSGTCTGTYVTTAADVTATKVTNTATATGDTGDIPVEGAIVQLDTFTSNESTVTVDFRADGPTANPKVTEVLPLVYCDTVGGAVGNSPEGIVPGEDWEVTLEVSPAAAPPGDFVEISVTLDSSPINVGPSTLAAGATRFDATVIVDGETIQLVGPTNQAPVEPFEGIVFPPNEMPIVAKGTAEVPDTEGLVEVVLDNLWFNSLNADFTGNGGALTGVFDLVCNTDEVPNESTTPIGTTVTFLADADAPPTGVTPTPTPTQEATETPTDDGTTGGTLPQTGFGLTGNLLAAALLLFVGLVLMGASIRPVGRHRLHG
jgi:uncharacterized repeat protein (TIGR01451 family)